MYTGYSYSGQCTVVSVLWSVYCGQCTVVSVLWSVYCGQCTVVSVPWSVYCGQCTAVSVLRSVYCGQCTVVSVPCIPQPSNLTKTIITTILLIFDPSLILQWDHCCPPNYLFTVLPLLTYLTYHLTESKPSCIKILMNLSFSLNTQLYIYSIYIYSIYTVYIYIYIYI